MPLFSDLDFTDDTPLVPTGSLIADATGDNTYSDYGTWFGEKEFGFGSVGIAIGNAAALSWSSPAGENVPPSSSASANMTVEGADVVFVTEMTFSETEGSEFGSGSFSGASSMAIGIDFDFMDRETPLVIDLDLPYIPGAYEFFAGFLSQIIDVPMTEY